MSLQGMFSRRSTVLQESLSERMLAITAISVFPMYLAGSNYKAALNTITTKITAPRQVHVKPIWFTARLISTSRAGHEIF